MRVHLKFLDGIRGLAALIVLLHHAYGFAIENRIGAFAPVFQRIFPFFLYAHYAVDVFIVLSGYCLMLPVALSEDGKLRGGNWLYFRRRARRMLPAYYYALGASALLMLAAQYFAQFGWYSGGAFPVWSFQGMIPSLLMVHNLIPAWAAEVNVVLWSVATEWQIYFVFPFLLLPVWRWKGFYGLAAFTIVLTVLIGLPYSLLPDFTFLAMACPWYIGLFAMGMLAALVNFGSEASVVRLRRRLPWRFFLPVFLVSAAVLLKLLRGSHAHWISDPLVGALTAAFLCFATVSITEVPNRIGAAVTRCLELPALSGLGTFSYSVYLTHLPMLFLLRALIPHNQFSTTTQFIAIIPLEIAICVGFAYVFFYFCERPFLKSNSAAATSPPPAA